MTATPKLTAEDLTWEEPRLSRSGGGMAEELCVHIATMRAALSQRRGSWAVLETFEKPTQASTMANQIAKRIKDGDSRLTGIEVTGRKMLEGGSKLYVRIAIKTGD